MPFKIYTILVLSVLFTGCSYHAKPVIQPYYPSDASVIPAEAESDISGRLDLLEGPVDRKTWGCGVHSFSIGMKSEFIKAVDDFVSSKFAKPVTDGQAAAPYRIEVSVINFKSQFDDPNEGLRIAFGLLAGVPRIESVAEMELGITVSKNNSVLIEDNIKAKGTDVANYWGCDDMRASVQRASERLITSVLQEMDKRVFVRLAMNSNRNIYNAGGSNSQSIGQKLKELDELQRQGLINRQEYEQKKKQLLDKF